MGAQSTPRAETATRRLSAIGDQPALSNVCGWVGTITSPTRKKALELASRNATLLRTYVFNGAHCTAESSTDGVRSLDVQTGPMSMFDQVSSWSCLIDLPARGWSARVPLLLHSGRVLLYVDRPNVCFYENKAMGRNNFTYHPIFPWQHYVPVRKDLADLTDMAAWVLAHPERARSIALRAQAHAQQYLTRAAALEALGKLLTDDSQKLKPTRS
eukprot:3330643-Prymnesium_polylepis.1